MLLLLAVLRTFACELAEYHIGIVDEILIDGKPLVGLAEMHPFRLDLNGSVPLLQKENVRDHLCSRV